MHNILPTIILSFFLFPFLSAQTSSRATFYGNSKGKGTGNGACGFGEYGRTLKGGRVTSVSRLFHNGTGCGACYKVRCKDSTLCRRRGVRVVATDFGGGYDTDFVMSAFAFGKLAKRNKSEELMAFGVVDVEYKRVSCLYPGHNMTIQIKEESDYPDYLAFIIVNQGGKRDVTAVQLCQEECRECKEMRRAYGGVWDIVMPPKGPISVKILTESDEDGQNWVKMDKVIPCDWKAEAAYESSAQMFN